MPDDDRGPTSEDLHDWLLPQEAVALLGWPDRKARHAIANRLEDGLIRSAAKTLVLKGQKKAVVELNASVWKDWDYAAEPLFWTNGDCEFYRQSSAGYGSYASGPRAYGVRFHPEGIRQLLEHDRSKEKGPGLFESLMGTGSSPTAVSRPEPARVEPPKKSTPVNNDDVKAWHRALAKPEKALGLRALWAKAKSDVGPGVRRKQIEPFVAGRRTGPKGPRQ